MLAKLTAKDQITLPKAAISGVTSKPTRISKLAPRVG